MGNVKEIILFNKTRSTGDEGRTIDKKQSKSIIQTENNL